MDEFKPDLQGIVGVFARIQKGLDREVDWSPLTDDDGS